MEEQRRRDTSSEAYDHLKASGRLGDLHWLVYNHVFQKGPLTIKQCSLALSELNEFDGTISARFAELREMGLLQEIGKTKCAYSGRQVLQWDVTSRIHPQDRRKRVSLRKQVASLEQQKRELVLELKLALQHIQDLEVFREKHTRTFAAYRRWMRNKFTLSPAALASIIDSDATSLGDNDFLRSEKSIS